MIKNIKIRVNVDQRGAITCGSLVNGRPKGLDYFDLSSFPELQSIYGDQPRSLVIYLPSDDLLSCFDCEYSAWGKAGGSAVKKRLCDGEECTHRVRETIGKETFAAGEIGPCVCEDLPEDDPARCKYSAHLKAYIAHPETRNLISPVCYLLRTHSSNSGEAVYSELQKVHSLTTMLFGDPRLTGMPFLLSVAMVSRRDDASRKFPIWRIQAMTFDHPQLDRSGLVELGAAPAPRALGPAEAAAVTAVDVEIELSRPAPDHAPIIAEIEELGEQVFGELWESKRADGALKVSGNETTELDELNLEQLGQLRKILEKALKGKA